MIDDAYFARFDTPKYRNENPLQRLLIRRFVSKLHSLFLRACPAQRVLEIGAGEGFLSGYLSEKMPNVKFSTVELLEDEVARQRRKFPALDAHVGSVYELGFLEGGYDIVMCCEVLEHVDEPERALRELRSKCKGDGHLLLTVPHEPFFMLSNLARGKNVSRFGNDIEHINHWGRRSFRRLLEREVRIEELHQSYPWLLALARPS